MDEHAQPPSCGRRTLALALVIFLTGLGRASAVPTPPLEKAGMDAKLAAAQAFLDRHQNEEAAAAFSQANEAAGGGCGPCLLGMARALHRLGRFDAAIAATRKAVAVLAGDPLQGRAYCELGDQLLSFEDSSQAAAEAEKMYGKALQAGAAYRAEAFTGIAEARLQLARYQQAIEAAQDSLAVSRTGATAGRARSAICRARRRGNLPSKYFFRQGSDAYPPRDSDRPTGTDSPLHVGGAVTKPVMYYAPAPVYTEEARKQRLQGVVIIEAVIDSQGCISMDHILKGTPLGLDRAALAAVEKWVFEPATLDGKPVKVYYSLTISFQVQ